MKIKTFLLVVGLLLVIAIAVLNWNVIMMPTTISLGIATVQAPLGFLMFILLSFFSLLILVVAIYSRTWGFFKDRQHSNEAQAKLKLTDNIETPEITVLGELLKTELKKLENLQRDSTATVLARIEKLYSDLHSTIKA